jgi:hypothetical protein
MHVLNVYNISKKVDIDEKRENCYGEVGVNIEYVCITHIFTFIFNFNLARKDVHHTGNMARLSG